MKTRILILTVAFLAIVSLGATRLANNETRKLPNAGVQQSSKAPIGGFVAEEK